MNDGAAAIERGIPSRVGAKIGLDKAELARTPKRVATHLAPDPVAGVHAADAAAHAIAFGQQLR